MPGSCLLTAAHKLGHGTHQHRSYDIPGRGIAALLPHCRGAAAALPCYCTTLPLLQSCTAPATLTVGSHRVCAGHWNCCRCLDQHASHEALQSPPYLQVAVLAKLACEAGARCIDMRNTCVRCHTPWEHAHRDDSRVPARLRPCAGYIIGNAADMRLI